VLGGELDFEMKSPTARIEEEAITHESTERQREHTHGVKDDGKKFSVIDLHASAMFLFWSVLMSDLIFWWEDKSLTFQLQHEIIEVMKEGRMML
jgi:hypothetical protein